MTRPQTMAAAFVSCETALLNSVENGNPEWVTRWQTRIAKLVEVIPRGSGIDRAPRKRSDIEVMPSVIRFEIGYHHEDDGGFYGWTDHVITIRPAFDGLDVRVSGRNRRNVKDYLHEAMEHAFTRHVTWDEQKQRWIVESDEERYAAMERAYPRAKVESAEVRP